MAVPTFSRLQLSCRRLVWFIVGQFGYLVESSIASVGKANERQNGIDDSSYHTYCGCSIFNGKNSSSNFANCGCNCQQISILRVLLKNLDFFLSNFKLLHHSLKSMY